MLFGLTNASPKFQQALKVALYKYTNMSCLVCFVAFIIISDNSDKHLQNRYNVLFKLNAVGN